MSTCHASIFRGERKDLMSKQLTVAEYIVERLAREGITDCFGVAGGFAFKLDAAVAESKSIRWIGCSNELDAAYAADGYARVRGCSMLLTTYAVGELSALDAALARASTGESASYIEVVGGRLDFPAGLAMAHRRLDALNGNG